MGEGQVAHFVIVLREPINSLLLSIVPHNDVRVLAALPRGKQASIVGDGEALNCVVVRCKEVLVVGILNIAHNDATADNQDVLASARMQMDAVRDGTTVANGMIKFDLASAGDFLLAESTCCDIGLGRSLELLRLRGDLLRHGLLHHYSSSLLKLILNYSN